MTEPPPARLRYLLLQVRNHDDPMRAQERQCFARHLHCPLEAIDVISLIHQPPSRRDWARHDMVLLGGSGDYSVAEGGPWFEAAMETMRELHDRDKPTFASCWGFQAMARAMGGRVVTDLSRAELGTTTLHLTPAGRDDPLFAQLGSPFRAQMGHQDIVDELPSDAVLLASSDRVTNEAFRFENKPIYCTQFHPELDRNSLLRRLEVYPQYVQSIAGVSVGEFVDSCSETPETSGLLTGFVRQVFA